MDFSALATAFQDLGPAVAAILGIVIITIIVLKFVQNLTQALLEMFNKHTEALEIVKDSMDANTKATSANAEATMANAEATLEMKENIKHNSEMVKSLSDKLSK